MPIARINHTLLHFVHVPKTGGSSIKDYLMKKGKVALYNWDPLPWGKTTPQHIEAATHEALVPSGFCDDAFMVLRDPLQRMVSEFRYRAQAHVGAGRFRVDLGQGDIFTGTFPAWVETVFEMAARDPWASDNHIRPQSDFWTDDVSVFLFSEGLEPVFQWIDAVTGTPPIARKHENRSRKLPVEITSGVEQLIRDFYREDYAFLQRVSAWEKPAGGGPRRKKPGAIARAGLTVSAQAGN